MNASTKSVRGVWFVLVLSLFLLLHIPPLSWEHLVLGLGGVVIVWAAYNLWGWRLVEPLERYATAHPWQEYFFSVVLLMLLCVVLDFIDDNKQSLTERLIFMVPISLAVPGIIALRRYEGRKKR